MRKILQFILKILAKLVLSKYKPVIIAVTGSVGKTSTKEAIYTVLRNHFGEAQVCRNERNYNNEIGVPLTIFGLETGGKSITAWFVRFAKVFLMLIFKEKYPRILIIEMGADRPGDIKYLTKFVKTKVGIITAIGEIPVHVEFFESPQALALEKKKLIDSLKSDGVAVLNYDDEMVKVMGENIRAKVLTYGFEDGADIRATNYKIKPTDLEKEGIFGAVTFKLNYKGSTVPVKLANVLGKHQVYSALAAATVGIIFNLNLVDVSEGLRSYRSLPGRMKLLKGIKNTLIIDDTYNAAPLSTLAALETLGKFEERRKIVVLGDMLEIGRYAPESHQRIGRKVAEVADLLFAVGGRAKFIAEGAREKGMPNDKIFEFCTSEIGGKPLQDIIEEGDIILVKASRAMKMEKIVREIMAEPRKAKTLLVQD
jgi:UDP-N-acetylmuramoyl-tripeptide--D-alanyl-D-alanine ligase